MTNSLSYRKPKLLHSDYHRRSILGTPFHFTNEEIDSITCVDVEDMNIFRPAFNLQAPYIPGPINETDASCALARWSRNTVTNPHQSHRGAGVTGRH